VGDSGVVFGTEDQADRRVFIWICPMLARVIQVEIHLSGVGVSEFTKFQLDNDQASKPSMEEEQIDPIPLCAHSQSLLTSNESKIIAQL
jgi:hypothetical protein